MGSILSFPFAALLLLLAVDGLLAACPSWEMPLKLTDLPINRSLLQSESGIEEDDVHVVPLVVAAMMLVLLDCCWMLSLMDGWMDLINNSYRSLG